jgi:hypothetical protein
MPELRFTKLSVSKTSGGTYPEFEIVDLDDMTDHINYVPEHP